MYGADETCHLDIPESAVGWSSMPICPSTNERYVTFSGTTDLRFTVEMLQEETIELDQPREVKLNARNHPNDIYQFTPTKDISDTQLDVTVTSESDVPAYLKVSREYKDVTKDNIKVVDYKGESLRLSFAKKGRITLSKFSIPPLTDSTSSWFIGIAIKNATGDTPLNATKTVTLTLKRSFDYSYAKTMWISQFAICFILGLVVSIFAWCVFRQWPSSVTCEKCCDFFCAMINVIFIYSFGRGPKTYSYITFIVGSVLMVGAFQFVFADWYLMIHEGDRDHCYYNDFCYRVGWADIPFNLIVSNLSYVIHGLILAVNVLCMESQQLVRYRKLAKEQNVDEKDVEIFAEEHKKKFSFSIGYAFAWALCFEGMFSALYHLCPSKLTFQFDTAFMFVIAGLSVVLLYNGIEQRSENPVGAANFFLFFLVPLFIFNYFGTMYHSEAGLTSEIKIPFFIFLIVWCIVIAVWAGYKLYPETCIKIWEEKGRYIWNCECCNTPFDQDKIVKFCLTIVGLLISPVVFFALWVSNTIELTEVFLFFCVAESVISGVGFLCMDFTCECDCCKGVRRFFKGVFVIVTAIICCFALHEFIGEATTNKVESPEKSRDLNQECVWLDFFDSHDLWHILSSFVLFMGALMVIHVSYPAETQVAQDQDPPIPLTDS